MLLSTLPLGPTMVHLAVGNTHPVSQDSMITVEETALHTVIEMVVDEADTEDEVGLAEDVAGMEVIVAEAVEETEADMEEIVVGTVEDEEAAEICVVVADHSSLALPQLLQTVSTLVTCCSMLLLQISRSSSLSLDLSLRSLSPLIAEV